MLFSAFVTFCTLFAHFLDSKKTKLFLKKMKDGINNKKLSIGKDTTTLVLQSA